MRHVQMALLKESIDVYSALIMSLLKEMSVDCAQARSRIATSALSDRSLSASSVLTLFCPQMMANRVIAQQQVTTMM